MNEQDFEKLQQSIRQAGDIRRGLLEPGRTFELRSADIKAIRARLEMTQRELAQMIGVSIATLRNWEQGRRQPHGPAQALLRVAAVNPRLVAEALGSA